MRRCAFLLAAATAAAAFSQDTDPVKRIAQIGAQVALLRRPDLVPQLATSRGINFTKAVELTKARPAEPGQTPIRLWAAFVVSTAQP
jgi:hypothetical protein